jgi:CheY-like chemotaxis protein
LSARETPVNILLIEDNPGDVRLLREHFKDFKLLNNLDVVDNGAAALQYLRRQEPFAKAAPPGIIILDLNLPRISGREILSEIKEDPILKQIALIILTSSELDLDLARTYDIHEDCYITKPGKARDFARALQSMGCFGISIVKLPPGYLLVIPNWFVRQSQ